MAAETLFPYSLVIYLKRINSCKDYFYNFVNLGFSAKFNLRETSQNFVLAEFDLREIQGKLSEK